MPGLEPISGRTALAEVVRRYLYAYGPATPQQFAQWPGAPRRWAAELFDSLSGELRGVELEGATAWLSAADTEVFPAPPRGVQLLPYFDVYAVGCHPRTLVFPGRAAERALSGGQAGGIPVLLVDGVVARVWHQRRSGRKLNIRVEPFGRLATEQRWEFEGQVERICAILEGKPTLTIGTVDAGKHL